MQTKAKIDSNMKAMKAKLDVRNAELDARHERMMAHLEKMEAMKLKANP
jgi:hypothetical protein